jgi:hypothetical protein
VVAGPRWFVRGFNDTAHLEQPWDRPAAANPGG